MEEKGQGKILTPGKTLEDLFPSTNFTFEVREIKEEEEEKLKKEKEEQEKKKGRRR